MGPLADSVQCATGDARAQHTVSGFQHKGVNRGVKAVPVFGHKEKAAAHGAAGGAQTATAGVLEGLARLQQGLLTDHAQTLNFFSVTLVVLDDPVSRDQLCGHLAGVGDSDGVSEREERVQRVALLWHVLGQYVNLDGIGGHGLMLAATITA